MTFLIIALGLFLGVPLFPPPEIQQDPGPEWVDVNRPKQGDEMTADAETEADVVVLCDTSFLPDENVLGEEMGLMLGLWVAAGWRYRLDLNTSWIDLHLFNRRT